MDLWSQLQLLSYRPAPGASIEGLLLLRLSPGIPRQRRWHWEPAFSSWILGACPRRGCRLQEQAGQMVPLRVPPPPPTRLSGKLSGLALPEPLLEETQSQLLRPTGSLEDRAKLLQGCGRGERV